MFAIFNPELSIRDNWKAAYPLKDAWYLCASDDLKSQYQNAGSKAALTASLIVVMQKDLHFRIGNDEFLAIGIQIAVDHTSEPKIIPNTLFESDSAQIDFERSKLSALNFEFMDVRVCKTADVNSIENKVVPELTSRMGRKRLDPLLAEALAMLRSDDPNFDDKTQEKKIIAIQDKVAEKHPGQYPNGATPGKTTVWRYLKNLSS